MKKLALALALSLVSLASQASPDCIWFCAVTNNSLPGVSLSITPGTGGTPTTGCGDGGGCWTGSCLLSATATSCGPTPPPDAAVLTVTMSYASEISVTVGGIMIRCINAHGDSQPIVMPAGATSCTFWFYATCEADGCSVHVCRTCTAQGQGPPEQ